VQALVNVHQLVGNKLTLGLIIIIIIIIIIMVIIIFIFIIIIFKLFNPPMSSL